MTYYVNVQTEGTDKYFNSEVEADTIELALEEAVRQLMQAWLCVPTIHPGQEEKLVITITADLKVTGSSWRIHLKQPCETPCPSCGGSGGMDSGGVDPQGRGIDIPCPSCKPEIEIVKRDGHRTLKVECMCLGCHPTSEWVKCPVCDEPDMRKLKMNDGETLIICTNHACASNGGGNNQEATKAKAERLVANDALNSFQDEVWGSLDKYSKALGWGLTGIQPECWTLLDSAVEELKERRKIMEEMCQALGLKDGDSLVEAVKLLKSTANEPITCSCYEPGRVTDPKCKVHGGSWVGGKT